jgi:hypothetical protein
VIHDAQAGLAQDDEAGAGDVAAEGGVKEGDEEDEEENLGEGGSRRRGRKVGDDL